MKQNLETLRSMRPYFKRGLVAFASIVALSCGFLIWKGPTMVRNMAISSLERNFVPLGVGKVEIDSVRLGWGRIYLRDIHTKALSTGPNLSIQEMDIALSPLLRVKAMDVVGATLELKEADEVAGYRAELHEKVAHFSKIMEQLKRLKLPVVALRDCMLIIPTSHGPVKTPVHATTETTVKRQQILTIDWGEQGNNMFSGQLVLETGRSGITFDIHSNNVDIQAHNFHIKAPEASLSSSSVNREGESHKIDGFVKLDHLTIGSLGLLKMPLEINLSAEGTPDNLTLNELTITEKGSEVTFLEVEGTLKPREVSAQLDLTVQVPQLSRLWDFTPLLAVHATDKVSVEGKVNLAGEFLLEKGKWVSSPLAIDMRGVSLSRAGFSIEGGAAQLVFNTVKPVVTKGPQRLSAKKINTNGVELRDVSLDGLFNEEGLLQLKDFKASTLNGHLKAHRFERLVDVSYPAFQFEVDFTDIELAEILRLTNLASLSGQAKLAGNASMRYDWKEGLDVVQAELHSVSDTGLIQYKPEVGGVEEAALKTQEVSMAFQVLNNLHFSLFNVRISHAPDNPSEMQGIVKILGSNPNVLNGYPFEFNIVTAGKLKDLVVNTLQHMKPPTDLKQLDQAIKATNDSKMVVDDNGPKEAKAVKKAKAVEATKVVKVFKKRKSKFKKRNRNRKVKYV